MWSFSTPRAVTACCDSVRNLSLRRSSDRDRDRVIVIPAWPLRDYLFRVALQRWRDLVKIVLRKCVGDWMPMATEVPNVDDLNIELAHGSYVVPRGRY